MDDDSLWQKVIQSVRPIKRDAPDIKPKTPLKATPPQAQSMTKPVITPITPPPTQEQPHGIDGHMRRKLLRGNATPEATIDLHGHTRNSAHDALHRFIHRSVAQGHRVVLVITGKGHKNKGMLRMSVPQWLREAPLSSLVLNTSQAHIKHGGAGAFYVVLKKR